MISLLPFETRESDSPAVLHDSLCKYLHSHWLIYAMVGVSLSPAILCKAACHEKVGFLVDISLLDYTTSSVLAGMQFSPYLYIAVCPTVYKSTVYKQGTTLFPPK